jgi:hypothetical protein
VDTSEPETKPIAIIEAYRGWSPPFDTVDIVKKLLSSVPERYLIGLRRIVLANRGGFNNERRRQATRSRGKKVRVAHCLGLYHQAFQGRSASIEIFVDAIAEHSPSWALRVPLIREMALGSVLFHELGHHIHATQAPIHREPEDVADAWKRKLNRLHFRRRYWYLLPLLWVSRPLVRGLSRRLKRRARIS